MRYYLYKINTKHILISGTITFSWKSSATIYAVCFYIVATVVVLVVGYERLMILRSIRRFDDYIYAIIFVIFLVPHFWIPFVGWGVAHQVAIYKTNWGKFQASIASVKCRSYLFSVPKWSSPKKCLRLIWSTGRNPLSIANYTVQI